MQRGGSCRQRHTWSVGSKQWVSAFAPGSSSPTVRDMLNGGLLCPDAIRIVGSVSGESSPLSIQRPFWDKNAPTKCGSFRFFYDEGPFAERVWGFERESCRSSSAESCAIRRGQTARKARRRASPGPSPRFRQASLLAPFTVNMLRKSKAAHCAVLHSFGEALLLESKGSETPAPKGVSTQI